MKYLILVIFVCNSNLLVSQSSCTMMVPRELPTVLIYGIHGGLAVSKISDFTDNRNISYNNDYKNDFNLGMSISFNLNYPHSILSFETGIYYIRKGKSLNNLVFLDNNGLPLADTINVSKTYNYFQVPLNLNIRILNFNNSNLYIQAGPYFAYLLSTEFSKASYEYTLTDKIENRFDVGLNVGLSYKYNLTERSDIGISYSYQYGYLEPESSEFRNISHVVNLSYFFYYLN